MKIRWKTHVTGTVHGQDGGVQPGDVMECDGVSAARYVNSGLAELVTETEEHAVIDPEVESAVVKPRRGRLKKDPEWHEQSPGWKEVESE